MDITTDILALYFDKFNKAYFEGKLPVPKFDIAPTSHHSFSHLYATRLNIKNTIQPQTQTSFYKYFNRFCFQLFTKTLVIKIILTNFAD